MASQLNEEGELIFGEQLEISKKVIFAKSSYLQDYFLVDSLFEQLNIFEQQIGVSFWKTHIIFGKLKLKFKSNRKIQNWFLTLWNGLIQEIILSPNFFDPKQYLPFPSSKLFEFI